MDRRTTPVSESRDTKVTVADDPLVTGLARDRELLAQLADREMPALRKAYKSLS